MIYFYIIFSDLHSLIGISLIFGFVFMLLVDQCSAQRSGGKERSFTATVGLVVHAAADGVALGAAATTSQADVEVVVFFAIMLHKVNILFFRIYKKKNFYIILIFDI